MARTYIASLSSSVRGSHESLFIDGPFEVRIKAGFTPTQCRDAFQRIQTYTQIYLAGLEENVAPPTTGHSAGPDLGQTLFGM